jgi:peroxiredoxin
MPSVRVGACLLLAAGLFGQEFKLGSKVGDFTLHDLKGGAVPFSSLRGSTTVVVFVATKCPISNGYNERMNAVYRDYSPRGVKFVFVNANSNEPAAEVAEHAASHTLAFPVYKDDGNVVADLFGATVTPETFVMDAHGVLAYHGYIDDSLNAARIQNQGLRKALDAVLAGRAVAAPTTKAFGCTIKKSKRAS